MSRPEDSSLSISNVVPPDAVAGFEYSHQISIAGGEPPYSWFVFEGTLPAGLAFNGVTGALSGTPLQQGEFRLVVRVTDTRGASLDVALALGIRLPCYEFGPYCWDGF